MAAFDTFIENINVDTAPAMENLTILIKTKYTKGISINYQLAHYVMRILFQNLFLS